MKKSILFLSIGGMLCLLLVLPIKTQYLPEPNTIGLWHLDSDALDSTEYLNDGEIIKGATFTDGIFDQALCVNGTNYVRIPNVPILNITEGSWEAWVNCDILPSVYGHHMNPFAKQEQYWIHLSDGTHTPFLQDSIQVKVNDGVGRYIATTGADFIEVGKWYHVMGTYDGDILKLYVNGVLVDTNTAPSGAIQTTSYPLAIGTWSTPTDFFIGKVDEVRLSNVVLMPVEIDIKPGSDPNSINLKDQGQLPVAILTTATFDVIQIVPESLQLGGGAVNTRGAKKALKRAVSYEDVDGDGDIDMMAFFSVPDLVLTEATTALELTGILTDGTHITGLDFVRVVPE